MAKRPTTKSPIKGLRNTKLMADVAEGMTIKDAAEKHGISRQRASAILNSSETKELIKQAENDIKTLITPAILRMEQTIRNDMAPNAALRAALAVLKNFGLLRESIDLNHQFPKPVVIQKRDGTQVILGTTADKDEEE